MADQTYTGPTETAIPIPNAGPPPENAKAATSPAPARTSNGRSKLPLVAIGTRGLAILLAIIALLVMATLDSCGVSFDEFSAFSYLVATMVIQIIWNIIMLVFEVLGHVRGLTIAGGRVFALVRFIGDFIVIFMVFSAASASAGVTTALDHQNYCSYCDKYCSQAKAATSMAFLSWAAHVPSFLLSTFIFFAFL